MKKAYRNLLIAAAAIPVILLCVLGYWFLVPKPSPIPDLFLPLAGQAIPKVELSIETEVDVPKKANLYRFEINYKGRYNQFDRAASALGIWELDAVRDYVGNKDRLLGVTDDGRIKQITMEDDTGFWTYTLSEEDSSLRKEAPSNEEAERIASRFLDENQLRPERFSATSFGGKSMGSSFEDQLEYSVTVFYYPTVDGYEVFGISRIAVEIDYNGEIEAVRSYYKDFVFDRVVDLAPPEQFYDVLLSGDTLCSIEPSAVSAKVTSIELAYWEDGGTIEDQPYLQPVWVYNGVAYDAAGVESEFLAIVPAVKR
ncbi:MAG: hypothetical protein LBI19_03340 [Oscillospiraceae bacterium]|jgi:hypothetical protein|nr:hypothetical protein [Oscillospiraceae bacterium]